MVKEFNELIGKTIMRLDLDILQVCNSQRICNHSVVWRKQWLLFV